MLNERIGKVHFWVMLIGFNLTFGPMHILGLQGMPRRYRHLRHRPRLRLLEPGVHHRCLHASPPASLIFLVNIVVSRRAWKAADLPRRGPDPWDARSLEWMVPSPPPEHNFDEIPVGREHRRVLAPQVRPRRRRHRPAASPPAPTSPRPATRRPTCTCRRRRTSRSCSPSACPSSATASSTTCGCAVSARLFVLAGMYGWVLEPVGRPRGPTRPPTTITDPTTTDAGAERRPGRRQVAARAGGGRLMTADRHTAHDRRPDRGHRGATITTRPPPASPTTSWRCGCSSASDCLLFGVADLHLPALQEPGGRRASTPSRLLRHPVHLGQLVRPAHELAHDGAGALGDQAGRRPAQPPLAAHHGPARHACSSAARSTSSPSSADEGLGYTTNIFGSAFFTLTGFHGVHVTVGIVMLLSLFVASFTRPPRPGPGRDGRDRRPVLALRRHRLDPDLHRRLPDSVT